MASSDMASIDPWSFRNSYLDPWFSEALSRDTQTLTKALNKSISDHSSSDFFSAADGLVSDPFPPLFTSFNFTTKPEEAAPTPAISNVSGGSDPEPAPTPSKRQRSSIPVLATSGKVSKRKPRASKRSQTTFITADPANFRQMVQQVTGVRFNGCSQLQAAAAILKPEPHRADGLFPSGLIAGGRLPTLDTSAFLLDHKQKHHQHQQQEVEAVGRSTGPSPAGGLAQLPYAAAADGGCSGGMDFDSFASFPTLESWNAM
ncbi:calmodulin-binding protein 25 [Punica granatum]|uniref:VQ domain-containing protein n=2 Tax=Punica granatum TaxID=22663 RepID=A0A218X310_PUNGR|nr:calmodulin-binding protein 25 [Punica granatum]OWM78871.1 hypothetical protein CDL15_Pgr003042 [Punica granatum]PKI31926.1 hypothetical protein CRG98_047644 [Punica granatum]